MLSSILLVGLHRFNAKLLLKSLGTKTSPAIDRLGSLNRTWHVMWGGEDCLLPPPPQMHSDMSSAGQLQYQVHVNAQHQARAGPVKVKTWGGREQVHLRGKKIIECIDCQLAFVNMKIGSNGIFVSIIL